MVVKGTGKEKTWRGQVVYNRNIQIPEKLLNPGRSKIMTVNKKS